jgi:hypothetical protein
MELGEHLRTTFPGNVNDRVAGHRSDPVRVVNGGSISSQKAWIQPDLLPGFLAYASRQAVGRFEAAALQFDQ